MKKILISTLLLSGVAAAAPLQLCPAGLVASKDGAALIALGDESNPRLSLAADPYIPGMTPADAAATKALFEQFKAAGITMVVLPLPPGQFLYGNVQRESLKKSEAIYQKEVAAFADAGFKVINLLSVAREFEAQGKPFFALRDHHWTPEAMQTVTQMVKGLVDASQVKIDRTAQTKILLRQAGYNGSYANVLEKKCGPQAYKPDSRTFFSLDINSGESLLGDTNTDTVVIGDSFGISLFGFPALVSDALKTPVIPGAVNGGGPIGGFTTYFSMLTPAAKPKLVIWVADQLHPNENNIREISATVEGNLYPKATLEKPAASTDSGVSTFKFTSAPKVRTYTRLSFSGPKIETQPVTFHYSDGTKEERRFYRRQDAVLPTYSVSFFYAVPNGKTLVRVETTLPAGVTVDVQLHTYH